MDGGRQQSQGMKEKLQELGSALLCLISPELHRWSGRSEQWGQDGAGSVGTAEMDSNSA